MKVLNIISKCWIGLLLALFLSIWGMCFSMPILVLAGIFLIYLSIKHGISRAKFLEEEKRWKKEFEGRLFLIYAAKKELQAYVQANILSDATPDLIELFYSGPKIVTQHGPISKYRLDGIYRNNGAMRLYKFVNGEFVVLEYFGLVKNVHESAENIKERIQAIYNNNS